MEKRRQNHSCNQCRKSKKACDGYLVNSRQSDHPSLSCPSTLLPCSYCLRTKKGCSLNPYWAQAQKRKSSDVQQQDPSVRNDRPDDAFSLSAMDNTGIFHLFNSPTPTQHDSLLWPTPFALPDGPCSSESNGPSTEAETPAYPVDASLSHLDFMPFTAGNGDIDPTAYSTLGPFTDADDSAAALADYNSELSPFNARSSTTVNIGQTPRVPPSMDQQKTPLSPALSVHNSSRVTKKHRGSCGSGSSAASKDRIRHVQHHISLSPFSIDHAAMTTANRSLISDSLFRVYQDVMENNLACWLAEENCPYQMIPKRRSSHEANRHDLTRQDVGIHADLGFSWPNRMYNRVKKLDRVAQASRLVRLSPLENKKVSKALDLTIISFAAQWAQGRHRKQGAWSTDDGDDDSIHDGSDQGGFEETLRQTLWEQARAAVQDVSDLESYRVVFAELIFGMSQKPWAEKDGWAFDDCIDNDNDVCHVRSSILPRVMDIISQNGPPVFMERAARKIHALKYRFEAYESGFPEAVRTRKGDTANAMARIGPQERQTIGLLYWFAIMTDTVSSAMNDRPVVVPDQDCPHDGAVEASNGSKRPTDSAPCDAGNPTGRWELDLYAQEDPGKPSSLQWPCAHEAASRAVARSAAVKVLFFRHIWYVQNALRNKDRPDAIEETLRLATAVHAYWSKTYGALFRQLTDNYDVTSPRVKSWFTCIAIPWHLGCLMLADLIDFVDDNKLGREDDRTRRRDTQMTGSMRKSSAIDLADLAAVAMPSSFSSSSAHHLPDFHFAVNESPLLTEPWNILLIRAFVKASVYHLTQAEEIQKKEQRGESDGREVQDSVRWGESCIRALQLLGTRSAMAKAVSDVLYKPLDGYDPAALFTPGEVSAF